MREHQAGGVATTPDETIEVPYDMTSSKSAWAQQKRSHSDVTMAASTRSEGGNMEREHVTETEERAGVKDQSGHCVDCADWLDLKELVRVWKIV
jgi:hypothetical protein